MTAPLAGLRVLDLSWGFAGTLTSLVLADYGAEVLRIEPPGGDMLRTHPAFPLWARGKRSVVLDLHTAEGRAHVRRLAERSDVLIETFRPGTAEALRLAYDDLDAQNPMLVYCSITGFGTRGPYARLKGYEGAVMAKMGGFDHVAGMAPRPGPAYVSMPYASYGAAQLALHGILAALFVREKTGRGQRVETSLVQGLAAHDPWEWFLRLLAEKYPQGYQPAPPYSERGVPNQSFAFRLLVCLSHDGRWLQFSQTAPHLFHEFMEVLGLAWMFDDPAWSTVPEFDTEAKREAFWDQMLTAARAKTVAEWDAIFAARPNVWAEMFRTTRELLDHPQMAHNGHVATLEHPGHGTMRQIAPFVRMTKTPAEALRPEPELGAHTTSVLDALRTNTMPGPTQRRPEPWPVRPLAGVTVLEFGVYYAAPFGTALLADLGARVIKLEPLAGDPIRHAMPVPDAGAIKMLQGKESVALALDRPEARAIVHALAAKADLVLMGYRAGVAEKLGVDYATLSAVNSRLVYLAAPGYGTDGPCGRKPAYAPTIGVATGIGLVQAGPSIPGGPDLPLDVVKAAAIRLSWGAQAPGNADGCSALGVATALLLGLVARERTGEGQAMLTSMLGTTAYAVSDDAFDYAGRPDRPTADPALYGMSALYRLYETAEGWVFLAAPKSGEWVAVCRGLVDVVDLAADPRFATAADRDAHDGALADIIGAALRTRSADAWEAHFLPLDVACVAVAKGSVPRATIEDPVIREAGFLAEVDHPMYGRHRRLAPLVTLSETPGEAKPAPTLGQHTDAVLAELGFDDDAVGRLRATHVVG